MDEILIFGTFEGLSYMALSGIYCITHISSGRKYIGQSPRLVARIQDHISYLNRGKHKNPKLQSYWNKYGSQDFNFQIIEIGLKKEELDDRERWYFNHIIDWNFDFNICRRSCNRIGQRPWNKGLKGTYYTSKRGQHMPEQSRIRVRNSILQQYRNGRSPWNKGKKYQEELLKIRQSKQVVYA